MQQPIKLGALSLLLAVVVICLAVLGVLTMATAHADLSLAQRQAENVTAVYAAEVQAQQWLADTAAALQSGAALPAGTQRDGTVLSAEIGTADGRVIHAAVDTARGTPFTVVCWQVKSGTTISDDITDLYIG